MVACPVRGIKGVRPLPRIWDALVLPWLDDFPYRRFVCGCTSFFTPFSGIV